MPSKNNADGSAGKGTMKIIDVAAAIIRGTSGEILICRRGGEGNCAGLWEFPGGKRERGESMAECLARECREELGTEIAVGKLFADTVYSYPDRTIHFNFFEAKILSGQPRMNVHRDMRWVSARELSNYDFCPADAKIVLALGEGKGLF